MRTGFIGLGAMGAPMARNIAHSGQLVAVWNRNLAVAHEFAREYPVRACENPAELAARCEAVCLCVSADQDVLEVLSNSLPGFKAGSVVMDFSTVSSETARKVASLLNPLGVAFLDCPVSGGVEGARNATLAIMIGGDEGVVARAMPLLSTLGKHIVHMGPNGSGQAAKAVNQIMAAGINQAVTEALAFGEAQGLPLERVIDVVSRGAASNWFLDHRGHSMTRGQFTPGFKVKLHYKDLKICQSMADARGFDSNVVRSTLEDYQRLIHQGHGDEDISALYRLKRRS